MAGENLSDHVLVKNVLIKMGIYFSVQVIEIINWLQLIINRFLVIINYIILLR